MELSDDNRTIYSQLMQLMFLSKHRMYKLGEKYDLSLMQSSAISMLDADEPKAMRGLSDYFMCDASTITGLADRLEARGLIERQNHPTDRRIKLVSLTQEGAALKKDIQDQMAEIESERLSGILTDDERVVLHDLLARIIREQSKS